MSTGAGSRGEERRIRDLLPARATPRAAEGLTSTEIAERPEQSPRAVSTS